MRDKERRGRERREREREKRLLLRDGGEELRRLDGGGGGVPHTRKEMTK